MLINGEYGVQVANYEYDNIIALKQMIILLHYKTSLIHYLILVDEINAEKYDGLLVENSVIFFILIICRCIKLSSQNIILMLILN